MSQATSAGELWGSAEIEAAARRILDAGLGKGESLIEPAVAAWLPAVAADMRRRIVDNPDEGSGTFLGKLRVQLDGAPRATYLLTAELLYVQVAPLSNVMGDTKKRRIRSVLSWLQPPAQLPADLDAALGATGAFNGGIGFNVQIWRQVGWLLSFVEHWWRQSDDDRATALTDPWAFREIVAAMAVDQPSIRNALLHLAFPRTFFPIVNQDHKRAIRNAFASIIGGATGNDPVSIDRDLENIRIRHLEDVGDGDVRYYNEPFASQWQKLSDEGERAWLVRPRLAGGKLVSRWRQEGFVSLAATHLGEVPPGADRQEVRTAVEAGYQHVEYAQRLALATEYHAFLTGMKVDDLVATVADDHFHVGVITGDPQYVADTDARLQRAVAWSVSPPAPVAELPSPLSTQLAQQGTIVDLTRAYALIAQLVRTESDTPDDSMVPEPVPLTQSGPPVLRAATPELAASLHTDIAWLQRVIDLLTDRQQIVLYGPPGTGKTFLARAIAAHLTDADAVRIVQFHPSYSYEDFFEGFRPTPSDDGSVGFSLRPGPMRALAAEARPDPARPYVLIIDEINRANLAKVFGELYFLLEYRRDAIRLQYSPGESFNFPENVFLIGTMNTADRSIASLDSAMRRRFAFVELHPDEPPVRDLLPQWLAAKGKNGDERAALLAALNAEIGVEDHDYKIGPSYLMTPDAERDGGRERIWEHSILPLLEEHYYGRLTRRQVHGRFGLAAIRAKAVPPPPPAAEP
ncbi:MAG: McrB family protein [Pseudonocardiaceae bacterium]